MAGTHKFDPVRCWEEQVVIPTYPVQDADPNPIFLETRVYQGSSGRVYPNPFTDKVALEKNDQAYRAIMLENERVCLAGAVYLSMRLPETKGRTLEQLESELVTGPEKADAGRVRAVHCN